MFSNPKNRPATIDDEVYEVTNSLCEHVHELIKEGKDVSQSVIEDVIYFYYVHKKRDFLLEYTDIDMSSPESEWTHWTIFFGQGGSRINEQTVA